MSISKEARSHNREEILSAAARSIAEHGYFGMSMRDLAKATGRGLASFYNYFSSKEDVLFALQSNAFQALISTAEESIQKSDSPSGKLHAFILNHVRYVAEKRDVMRVLVHEAGALPPSRRKAIRSLKEGYFRLGRDCVRDVMEQGSGRKKLNDDEVQRSAYALFGMLNWLWSWYEPRKHGTPEDVARTYHRIALCGLVDDLPSHSAQEDVERRMTDVHRLSLIRARPEPGVE